VLATEQANFVILEARQPLFTDFVNVPFAPGNEKTEMTFIFELSVRQRAFEIGFEIDDVLEVGTSLAYHVSLRLQGVSMRPTVARSASLTQPGMSCQPASQLVVIG
jgi:hypothetical protein